MAGVGPEYKRARMLAAAELLRAVKVSHIHDLALSHWCEVRKGKKWHVLEVLNTETRRSVTVSLKSPLDVPAYAEFAEAVMLRCRV